MVTCKHAIPVDRLGLDGPAAAWPHFQHTHGGTGFEGVSSIFALTVVRL